MKLTKLLVEKEYKDFLGTQTYGTLRKKSAESLRTMLKGKNFMQASMESMQLLPQIMEAEKPYRDYLEEIAKDTLEKAFPIVKQAGIQIIAKIVSPGTLKLKDEDPPEEEQGNSDPPPLQVDKRRLINAITHGASIRGTKAYFVFRDIINTLDDTLLEKYNTILDSAYGIYDDDNAIAMFMAMLSQNQGSLGGVSEADWDEETQTLTIRASAIIFPILVHELVKGLYEILSLQGFSGDAEQNKRIVKQVDKVSNEPEDLRYGKFIYDALSAHYENSKYKNPALRELLFVEIYKLPDKEFKEFVENSINETLSFSQKKWIATTLENLDRENKDTRNYEN